MANTVEIARKVFSRMPAHPIAYNMLEGHASLNPDELRSGIDYLTAIGTIRISACSCKRMKHFYYTRTVDETPLTELTGRSGD